MTTTYEPDVQIADLIGGGVKRLRGTPTHAILTVDTEEHDLELVRAIADAVRSAGSEAVDALVEYAEIRDRIDEHERDYRNTNHAHRLALTDEAADALGEITRHMDIEPGEELVAVMNPGDVGRLYEGLGEWTEGRRAKRSAARGKAVA